MAGAAPHVIGCHAKNFRVTASDRKYSPRGGICLGGPEDGQWMPEVFSNSRAKSQGLAPVADVYCPADPGKYGPRKSPARPAGFGCSVVPLLEVPTHDVRAARRPPPVV